MSSAEITAYLYGAELAAEASAEAFDMVPHVADDPSDMRPEVLASWRRLGEKTFAYWAVRGSEDWLRSYLTGG